MSYSKLGARDAGRADVGFSESPPGSNCNPYSERQYGVRCPGGGWCASACSAWAIEGGFLFGPDATYGPKGFSYTESMEQWARAQGLWRDKWWRSQPGDWWIFDWNGDGLTDHVEEVDHDDGAQAVTIGGNTGNAVRYRLRDRVYLVGIVALSQSPQAAPPMPTKEVLQALARLKRIERELDAKPLERGDTDWKVAIIHQLFVEKGLLGQVPRYSNTFGKGFRDANLHLKRLAHLESQDPTRFGGDAFRALLQR